MMRVAVTGASGFIGTALCERLAQAGYQAMPVALRQEGWRRSMAGSQAVVHLAGIAHRAASRQEMMDVNVVLTGEVARAAAADGASFVYMSSIKAHGEHTRAPLRADSPLSPQDAYGESKARAEDVLHAVPGLRLSILRPPLVYGPGVKGNFLSLMKALARGWPLPLASIRNRRSLVYVENLVAAVIGCLVEQGTFLVSDGPAPSTPQLCAELAAALGQPARLFPFPPSLLPAKLRQSLEIDEAGLRWKPPFSREQGLRATAQWYRGL